MKNNPNFQMHKNNTKPNKHDFCHPTTFWHNLMYAISIGVYFCAIPAIPLMFCLAGKGNYTSIDIETRFLYGVLMSCVVTMFCAFLFYIWGLAFADI